MSDRSVDEKIQGFLEELGPADPPATLVPAVMKRVADVRWRGDRNPATGHSVLAFSNRGGAMTRKVVWALAAAAAIILAVFVVRGFPPAGTGTEGTIGAAKRY